MWPHNQGILSGHNQGILSGLLIVIFIFLHGSELLFAWLHASMVI